MWRIFLWLSISSCLFADTIDPSMGTFTERPQKYRVDLYDFSGEFAHLETVDIDARRKKKVEALFTGEYPLLRTIHYEGSFGSLDARLTGNFPQLALVNILCGSTAMQLDLSGLEYKDCIVNVKGKERDIFIQLPKNVGVILHTNTYPTGKVVCPDLRKEGRGMWKRTFVNDKAEEAEVVLTLHVELPKACLHISG